MKKAILSLIILVSFTAYSQKNDSTFYVRPYYKDSTWIAHHVDTVSCHWVVYDSAGFLKKEHPGKFVMEYDRKEHSSGFILSTDYYSTFNKRFFILGRERDIIFYKTENNIVFTWSR